MPDRTRREWAVLVARIIVRVVLVGGAATAGAVGTHVVKEQRTQERLIEQADRLGALCISEVTKIIDAMPECAFPEIPKCEFRATPCPPCPECPACYCCKETEYGCLCKTESENCVEDPQRPGLLLCY